MASWNCQDLSKISILSLVFIQIELLMWVMAISSHVFFAPLHFTFLLVSLISAIIILMEYDATLHNHRKIMMVAIVFRFISFLYFIYMFEQCMYLNTLDTADIELYSQYNFDKIPIPGAVRSYLEFNTIFSGVFMGWELCKIIFDILFCVLSPPGKRSFVSVV